MSKEEIIKYVNEIIKDSQNEIKGKDYFEYIMTPNDIKAIQGLLDLYNKEKEKNKELEKYKKYYETEKVVWSRKNYISKDKIRKQIENYVIKSKHPLVNSQSRKEYTFGIKALQELLEE